MYLIQKMTTAFRGAARESGEQFVDANAIRIFEQEIHDCEHAIILSKRDLARVMAEKKALERRIRDYDDSISRRETEAMGALEKGLDALAEELAEVIAGIEADKHAEEQVHARLSAQEAQLRKTLQGASRKVEHFRRELRLAKATRSSLQSTALLNSSRNNFGDRLMCMQESLERIRQRQAETRDYQEAMESLAEETGNADLDRKVREAGVAREDSAARVLARLRQQQARE